VLLHPSGELTQSYSDESLDAALRVWEPAAKYYKKYWNTWISFVDFSVLTVKNIPRARKAFKEFQGTHLAVDYPEAVCEAWISFEERWGTAKELEDALSRVCKLTDALNEKRAKDAYRVSKAQHAKLAESGPSPSTTRGIAPTTIAPQPTEGQDELIAADAEASATNYPLSSKCKAQDEAGPESKKLKPEPPPPALKRDRENAALFTELRNFIEFDGSYDRGSHVKFDINSLVVLKRILEASSCVTSQALDSFICCVLYRQIH